jgi:hypothetical protein
MKQRLGLYMSFKRTLSFCFASLICSFVLIESSQAQPPPPPTVPAGDLWGYVLLIGAIAVYARWSKRRSRNKRPEDES